MISFDPSQTTHWISIIFIGLGIHVLYQVFISIRELKEFNNTKKDLKENQFVFKTSIWYFLLNLIPLIYLVYVYQENLISLLFLTVCLVARYTVALLHQKQIYSVNDNEIALLSSLTSIKASELTGLTIESDEVGFHTAKYQNHYIIERKNLKGKSWSDFLKAIEAFAERNNLPIEKA